MSKMRSRLGMTGRRGVAVGAATVMVLLAVVVIGCSSPDSAAASPGTLADTLTTFVGDFARQLLAAWLL